jgi:hypothetical protein
LRHIVGLFVVTWLAALGIWRWRHIDERRGAGKAALVAPEQGRQGVTPIR